jgi:Trk K+ transport system NAD-binding subunit
VIDYMNLTATSGMARMRLPAQMVGQRVSQIEAARPQISIVLIQRGNVLLPRPTTETTLQAGDVVLVAGLDEAIDAFADN